MWGEAMPDYILLMHDDAEVSASGAPEDWDSYLKKLEIGGYLRGGSAIGSGLCVKKAGISPNITSHLTGFIRIKADSLEHARMLLADNPTFEAGGTVEIRELPVTS
jgi:hypothetical protein